MVDSTLSMPYSTILFYMELANVVYFVHRSGGF